ncbi:MAG: BON domain-containing protein [Fimbriiglobus sp.]|nr:BON domain-containing protein [Fimbriiglobus sp.]
MTLKTLKLLVAVGALSGSVAIAQDAVKAKLPPTNTATAAANQKLAEKVAKELSALPGTADVKVITDAGTVTLLGTCKEDAHKAGILKAVRVVDGVTLVKDGLMVEKAATPPAPMPSIKQMQAIDGGPRLAPAPSAIPPGAMPYSGPVGDPSVEPMPLGAAGAAMGGSPPLPPYAWPTYAPYPNMSRVAYPSAYPYNAFPYIGPYYPFPKVPLGWRSVTLSWEDGHWWLGRKQTPADYWRVKFGY